MKKRKVKKSRKSYGVDIQYLSEVRPIAAWKVLHDCRLASERFKTAETKENKRLDWILCVTLLRVVGHVLKNVDAKWSVNLEKSIQKTYNGWKNNPDKNRIFYDFIENERNAVLKEYITDPSVENTDGNYYILISQSVFTPEQIIDESIEWWVQQLRKIEGFSKQLLNNKKQIADKK